MSAEEAQNRLEKSYTEILTAIGEDPEREGVLKTPKRAAKAFQFFTKGYKESLDDLLNEAVFTDATDEMVIVRNIQIYSLCEHHLVLGCP